MDPKKGILSKALEKAEGLPKQSIIEERGNEFDSEFIADLARKYANASEFKTNFPHDWNSTREGFEEGFRTALRLLTTKIV